MRTSDAFPSTYLKASDLGGRTVAVTISHVETEAVGRQKELKLVVYFEGKDKGIVLNKTNCRMIEQLSGSDETDDWKGTRIALYAKEVDYQGETVMAIRIKAAHSGNGAKRQAPPPPPPPDDDDDPIPF